LNKSNNQNLQSMQQQQLVKVKQPAAIAAHTSSGATIPSQALI
jgi:ABC-type branched-subunit amino acid transport system substrate-binding protein